MQSHKGKQMNCQKCGGEIATHQAQQMGAAGWCRCGQYQQAQTYHQCQQVFAEQIYLSMINIKLDELSLRIERMEKLINVGVP